MNTFFRSVFVSVLFMFYSTFWCVDVCCVCCVCVRAVEVTIADNKQ
jgi:hypothetical protein